jgi:hypothetical protein
MRARARGFIVRFVCASTLVVHVDACAAHEHRLLQQRNGDDYCTPPGQLPRIDLPLVPLSSVHFSDSLRAHYSLRSLGVAYGAGALPDLEAIEQSAADRSVDAEVHIRAHADRVLQRLQIADQQISAIVAELDCEGERADQMREYMQEREERSVRILTAASIAAGGASSVALGFLGRYAGGSIAEEVVGITGGVATAGLGLGIFFVHERRVFSHRRNLLAEIWRGPARSDLYPPIVWYYLTQREFSNSGERPIRENVIARWSRFEHLSRDAASQRARRAQLFFGSGGIYSVDDLVIRAALLEQARSAVALLDQEIDRLARELILRTEALAPPRR